MTESSASVYRERGRIWIRMELSEEEYRKWMHGMSQTQSFYRIETLEVLALLEASEHEKTNRADIFDRIDTPDEEMNREEGR